MTGRKFVIFSGGFDEYIGGVIALHRLCDLLNRQGYKAYLWPERRPLFNPVEPLGSAWRMFRFIKRRRNRRYTTRPGFETPIARPSDLHEAIVVYPEVIAGNPLRAKHVVRWLLHKPGFHTGKAEYGPDDRFFFCQKAFDDPRLNPDGDNLLQTVLVRDDIYQQVNFGERRGTCYLIRKGKGREIAHDLSDSILVDDLSHAQLAEVFNRVQTCISYDMYTNYSLFAALCGCTSVVVPMPGLTIDQWYPDPRDRYGLAYGFDDIEHAHRTRHLLLPHLKSQERLANESVRLFAEKCKVYFP
jgi:hypothetical protein